ncbi:hypothetical protein CLTEP_18280 [Clostridium tepidiprofundi DSM 19306]|uniref:Glyoxalase/fosfomycin resistance/dioxygenase domain-containing protein n=1 Tax=Clostridium tepidiprofundi DSM 19306 TaxID=1121338 RepID=A0A151B395_9CLOT|nr:VOC family protein [Clostridium tepidiprofundi]KYH34253.1 hypothetical protein CLTEP_18280 [Clostridium tepidiprofundi DSM 19306]
MRLELTLNSLYICVKDMNRAINFYEQFFEQKVDKKDDIFSVFINENQVLEFKDSEGNDIEVYCRIL